jgi:CRP/FNR family transcriptional regulator, cyclic AMP receptor protein
MAGAQQCIPGRAEEWFDVVAPDMARRSIFRYRRNAPVFCQGEPADAVFFVVDGKVKLTTVNPQGKEAVIAVAGSGDMLGEACILERATRSCSAKALESSTLLRIENSDLKRNLRHSSAFMEYFLRNLLFQKQRAEEELVNQFFYSSEKRLAKVLLMLAARPTDGGPLNRVPRISQETLGAMVGTTRSRISFFLNKFQREGRIEYQGGIHVNPERLRAVLND